MTLRNFAAAALSVAKRQILSLYTALNETK
jgi:hypothetical protein